MKKSTFITVLYYTEYNELEQEIRDRIIDRLEKGIHWYGYYVNVF